MTADQDVDNALNGVDGNGNAEPFFIVARFYDGHMFGRSKDYAFPVGPNTTPSKLDDITCLSKLLTRTQTLADGNDYDAWDCLFTLTKAALAANVHLNDNEVNSVNYKAPSA